MSTHCARDSDEARLIAYLAGDARGFDAIFRCYAPLLAGYFRRRAFQAADCQDLVQQTFLQLHRSRADFRQGERLRPWLFTIARNVACDHARRVARRAEQSRDLEHEPAPVPSHELLLQDAWLDAASALSGALAKLSCSERRLIDEHFAQERTFGELASRDGIHPGTLRVRAHRARARLRAMLADQRRAA